MEERKYEIGDKIYIQRPLVLGQWRQLGPILQEISLPAGDISPASLVSALGQHFFDVLAIILTPEGASLRNKDIPSLAAEIEFAVMPETAIEVIADFFGCNPIPSLLDHLTTLTTRVQQSLTGIGLTKSASSSAGETSPGATGSSGMSPQKTPAGGPPVP